MKKKGQRLDCGSCITDVQRGGVGTPVPDCTHHGPNCKDKPELPCNGWVAQNDGGFGYWLSCCGHDHCIIVGKHDEHASQRPAEGCEADYDY